MTTDIRRLNGAIDWALGENECNEPVSRDFKISDTIAANAISVATEDDVVDNEERVALARLDGHLGTGGQAQMRAALARPRESATTIAARARAREAEALAREVMIAGRGSQESQVVGGLLGLMYLFGGK